VKFKVDKIQILGG